MNKMQINIPEGFEIDQSKSDLSKGIIEFKSVEKKKLSYGEIAKELFYNKEVYYTDEFGRISKTKVINTILNMNNSTSKEQLECLMAYNKLRNVAEYLNETRSLKPTIQNEVCIIIFDNTLQKIKVSSVSLSISSHVYFKTLDLAKQAIEILGEEEVKKALFIY